jgi:hypothetical protein
LEDNIIRISDQFLSTIISYQIINFILFYQYISFFISYHNIITIPIIIFYLLAII